ncbi:REP13E12 repeat protein [Mycobacterium rhizamassiliense]|uniref:REP13E12 repeat protein n=1 Tax=Mycobacterium rhizamassiliense TaxID=1841860 RepID=A0A2U3NVC6_9MYCO|nr:HNH endonuclease signature motif containing protein [Mycobacterium rhizamassiliense]SPM35413.1 REP13E12 repeat protein [Mycobacterium rhizamassiliense]
MHSITREEFQEDYDALRAVVSRIQGHSYDALTTPEHITYLEALEEQVRRLQAPSHELINQLDQQATPAEIGGKLTHVLADRLRITRGEATRRVSEARDLGTRQALTGEPLPPRHAATAAAQRAGRIGTAHVSVIRQFFDDLPCWVDAPTREAAETDLARWAGEYRPELLRKAADRLACYLNPDGQFHDEDRARHRGLTLGTQHADGMSRLSGWLTPEARATVEAVLAKVAAPGMCNPDDHTPAVDEAPSEEAIKRDTRSAAQRNHDGLQAALRAVLASGELGQHNGLPASIVVTTTLRELETATGKALTGGGTLLPIADVIRMARHAHHYLAIFDNGRPVGLYHAKRLASAGQRIVLHAKDRGCSAPGCDVPGYLCEVHHVDDYAACQTTDIDNLTFACGPHHRLVKPGGWQTRKRANGDTEWIPPPHLDRGQPRTNTFHHPENLLSGGDEDP